MHECASRVCSQGDALWLAWPVVPQRDSHPRCIVVSCDPLSSRKGKFRLCVAKGCCVSNSSAGRYFGSCVATVARPSPIIKCQHAVRLAVHSGRNSPSSKGARCPARIAGTSPSGIAASVASAMQRERRAVPYVCFVMSYLLQQQIGQIFDDRFVRPTQPR